MSQQASRTEAQDLAARDHKMVEHGDVERLRSRLDAPGELDIRPRRGRVAARMVVDQDDGGRADIERPPADFAGIGRGAVDSCRWTGVRPGSGGSSCSGTGCGTPPPTDGPCGRGNRRQGRRSRSASRRRPRPSRASSIPSASATLMSETADSPTSRTLSSAAGSAASTPASEPKAWIRSRAICCTSRRRIGAEQQQFQQLVVLHAAFVAQVFQEMPAQALPMTLLLFSFPGPLLGVRNLAALPAARRLPGRRLRAEERHDLVVAPVGGPVTHRAACPTPSANKSALPRRPAPPRPCARTGPRATCPW